MGGTDTQRTQKVPASRAKNLLNLFLFAGTRFVVPHFLSCEILKNNLHTEWKRTTLPITSVSIRKTLPILIA